MQKLQLYIGAERLDLFKDETVSFTQTIQNVKDIKKIFTEFSKTFSLPASSVNQKIFSHYYNFDIQGGFDARNKVAAKIELNTIPFKEGFIKLEGVDLKNNVAHTYRITFFGNTINLVDVLGDDQLSRLTELGTYNTTYEYSTIRAGLISGIPSTNNLCVPLITHTDRLTFDSVTEEIGNVDWVSSSSVNGINFKQLKFALRLQAIIAAIQTETRYQNDDGTQKIIFSDDFFNDSTNEKFHNLWMWLHRKKGSVEPTTQLTLNFIPVQNITQTSGSSGFTSVSLQGVLTLLPDGQTNADGGILQYVQTKLELIPTVSNVEYSVRVLKNSQSYEERLNVTGTQIFFNTSSTQLSAGSYIVEIASLSTITFAATNIEWTISAAVLGGQGGGGFTDIFSNQAQISSNAIVPFIITQQIPEMTVISFLTSIFKMFNLTAFVNNAGVIVVKTLDSYYASGSATPIVIDEYLDVTKSTVNVALPFKEIDFGYKGLGTFLAKQFNQVNNSGWGSTRYTLNNATFDASNNTYKVGIPFEHVMYERLVDTGITTSVEQTTVQYGFFVDDNQESYYGLPLIFYAIRQLNQNPIALKDGPLPGGVNQQINDYIIPSNSLQIGTTNQTNINFNAEINEFDGTEFLGTLFNNNYSTYINNVFDTNRRLIKVNAVLPQKIFHNLELNNLIQIRQQNYQINSITTNLTNGRSQLELLNVGTPYFRSLENITFQGTSGGTLYYRFSIGVATSITVGNTMFTNQTLTTTAGAGSYIQTGSATNDTFCENGCFMTMILNTSGIVTSITCGCP